jgi:predicted phosphohydrolase
LAAAAARHGAAAAGKGAAAHLGDRGHASGCGDRQTMDRFGPAWENHARKIQENCARVVDAHDLLLLPGDLSWAMRRAEAEPDLAFLATLPGAKIVIKGNHDYWWPSGKPLNFPGLQTPPVLLESGALGIAGTRGWFEPVAGSVDESANRKILERERARLQRSLEQVAGCATKVAMLHYPPHPFLPELAAAGVTAVAYGHLHRGGPPDIEQQVHDGDAVAGMRLFCVACDRIQFTPRLIGAF